MIRHGDRAQTAARYLDFTQRHRYNSPMEPDHITTKTSINRQSKVQGGTCYQAMRLLQEQPDMSQYNLANRVGARPGGLNCCLNPLMKKGFVKLTNFQNSKLQFKYACILTSAGMVQKLAMTNYFLKRKLEKYGR